MSSTVGVSSLYPELASSSFFSLRRVPPPRLFSFPRYRSHFQCFTLFQQGGGDRSIASSAVVTPNSVFSEEAFKGLTGFSHDALRHQEEEEEEEEEGEGEEDHPSSDVGASGGDSTPDRDLAIANLGLPQPLVDSLHKRGITHLFPIQRAVLVPALDGRDIIARAKTGTGKTLAFGIPIIKSLTTDDESRVASRCFSNSPLSPYLCLHSFPAIV